MKQTLVALICLCSGVLAAYGQTRETFDISSFVAPKGWNRQATENAVLFSIENKDSYCLITLYKSMPGLADPQENFTAAWETIVAEAVAVSAAPEMFPSDNKGDWLIAGGYAPFEKDGEKGVAILYTASGYGTMVNALVITNTQAYEETATAFLNSISFKKPAAAPSTPAVSAAAPENSIVGTWGQNVGASMTYGDPVAAGMAGYGKYQYTFNANGTYTFASKTFRMSYDKIILVRENGTYRISGETLSIEPQKSVIQAWSKLNGGDGWGRMLSSQARKLEPMTYKFTKHYFSGIDEWNLVLQADRQTDRDGPHSTFALFPNAWYYKPITNNNPVIVLPN